MTFTRPKLSTKMRARVALAAAMLALLCCGQTAQAQNSLFGGYQPPPASTDMAPELKGVTLLDANGTQLPMNAVLVDDKGNTRTLREILPTNRPTILQIGYMRCPMLCSLVMNALVRGIQPMDWTVGKEFDVVSLSIDPREKADLAAAKKAGYVAEYGRGADGSGWHFLTGDELNVKAVADAVGFKYTHDPKSGEYLHAAAIFLITPDGKLSRAIDGVAYETPTVRMGLLEASEGKIGSIVDRIILWCHIYNSEARGYQLFAMNLMKLGGAITVLVLGGGLLWFWRRDYVRRRLSAPETPASAGLAMSK